MLERLLCHNSPLVLAQFCDCHNIRELHLEHENLSADAAVPEPFTKQLLDFMKHEKLTLEQVYNCDQTLIYYRMLPATTLAGKAEKHAPGIKSKKNMDINGM